MKKSSIFLALLLAASCSLIDGALPIGTPRAAEGAGGRYSSPDSAGPSRSKDTLLLVSAVVFDSSYDWQRDTAFGSVPCTVKLFKGSQEVISLPGGPEHHVGAAADGHHIIDGSLFTTYSFAGGTWIGRDGVQLAHWSEREYITGLSYREGVLYTRGVGSDGFCFRRDGTALLKIPGGEPFGNFGQDTYGPHGALYEDGGAVCFAYHCKSGESRQAYVVRDGEARLVLSSPNAKFVDLKLLSGEPALLYHNAGISTLEYLGKKYNISHSGMIHWEQAGVSMLDGSPVAVGRFTIRGDEGDFYGIGRDNTCQGIDGKPLFIYLDGSRWLCLDSAHPALHDSYLLGRACTCLVADSLAIALTPKDGISAPYTILRGEKTEYPIHGFLSGISMIIE